MPRPASTAGLTIAQLEQILRDRRGEVARLEKRRKKIARDLAQLDARIMSLGGSIRGGAVGRNGRGGGRARNAQSLPEAIAAVLGKSAKAMKVGDIENAVLGTGYQSSSPNFRGIVNQALIKDKRFTSASRGLYQMKK